MKFPVSISVEPVYLVAKIAKGFLCTLTLKKCGTHTPLHFCTTSSNFLVSTRDTIQGDFVFYPNTQLIPLSMAKSGWVSQNLSCTRESVRASARRRITLGCKGDVLVMLGSCLRSLPPFTPFLVFSVNKRIMIKMRRCLLLSSKPQTAEFKMLGLRNKWQHMCKCDSNFFAYCIPNFYIY